MILVAQVSVRSRNQGGLRISLHCTYTLRPRKPFVNAIHKSNQILHYPAGPYETLDCAVSTLKTLNLKSQTLNPFCAASEWPNRLLPVVCTEPATQSPLCVGHKP